MKYKTVKASIALGLISFTVLVSSFANQEKNMRTIKKVHKPQNAPMGDLITYRAMPTPSVDIDQLDPFLFLNHHGPQVYNANNSGLPFGPHPHKGFETVTFILDGDILHKDNSGHESIIDAGGIQWMTAGKGIIHSEVSSDKFKKEGGKVEILQLWVNLPSEHKNTEPKYIGLQKEDIPVIRKDEGRVEIHHISGAWDEHKAPIQTLTDVLMSYISFKPGGKLSLDVDTSRRVFLYVVKGDLKINNQDISAMRLVEFNQDGQQINIESSDDAVILYGHAEPTNEPVVARGPFVMNSMEEIREAYQDYEEGKFGSWE